MDQSLIRKARRRLLRMHFEAKTGHIGGNLSCLDILMTLYHDVMKPEDQFILSKGHAAGALYVTLWSKGILSDEQLTTFHKDNTDLPGHTPANKFPSIPFATGSLGHGVSLGCGLALAKRLRGESGRVYVLTSDGEWGEGSTWEALMFAIHHKLTNLTIIIDNNGLQGMGLVKEISNRRSLDEIIDSFMHSGCTSNSYQTFFMSYHSDYFEEPDVIIVNAVKGHGVSFMENDWTWHYMPMNQEQYEQALAENPE